MDDWNGEGRPPPPTCTLAARGGGGASPWFWYATPPPPCPSGPLSCQGSTATGHTYGGAEGPLRILSTLHPNTILEPNLDSNAHPNPQPTPNPTPKPYP